MTSHTAEELERHRPGRLSGPGAVRWDRVIAAARAGEGVVSAADATGGVATAWSPSPWDADLLGVSVARALEPVVWGAPTEASTVVARSLGEAVAADLLVVRVPATAPGALAGWAAGYEAADINLRYRARPESAGDEMLEEATSGDREALVAMARIFRHDHFHTDTRIAAGRADDLYRAWIVNSLEGRADAVLVVRPPGGSGVAGFITCVFDEALSQAEGEPVGVIELVGVDPAHRGIRAGSRLVAGAVTWFAARGVRVVDVGTQLSNAAAIAIYERSGFRLTEGAVTLHRWRD